MPSKKIKIINIVGARPNFIKIAPLLAEQKKYPKLIQPILVHTGQHYSPQMSAEIFHDLGMPRPDVYLGVGSGSHAQQTAALMVELEKVFLEIKPDLIIVVGDVNSTLAASLVAVKMGIKIAHVEAGLRSRNRVMPEEINRILTDQISDYLFITEESAIANLRAEGIPAARIHFVGNVMIDTLLKFKAQAANLDIAANFGLKEYILVTMHRAENVDQKDNLQKIFEILKDINYPIIFPVHPRTKKLIKTFRMNNFVKNIKHLTLIEPQSYMKFVNLQINARAILTDSGGIQEEATILGIPCLTLRTETERPITVTHGTNQVVGLNKSKILTAVKKILKTDIKEYKNKKPKLWDGRTAERIIKVLIKNIK